MSAYENLLDSDTRFFKSINYNLNGPKLLNPGPRWSNNDCVSKKPGELKFKLNTINDLGFDKPFDFDLEFIGQFAGNDLNGNTLIRWDVNQNVNHDYTKKGITAHVDKVVGSIMTVIFAENPRLAGNNCKGEKRSMCVNMQTQSDNNALYVQSELKGTFTDLGIKAESITWDAVGADQFSIDAQINVVRNECGIAEVFPDGTIEFWAQVNNLPIGDSVGYKWTVSNNAMISGAKDQSNCRVQPINLKPIIVQAIITIEGVSQAFRINYKPETNDSERIKLILCRLVSELRVNFFVDPLYDPLRDYIQHPLAKSELKHIEQFANNMLKNIKNLSELKQSGK